MAFHTLASSSGGSSAPAIIFPITEKLTKGNYPTWRMQALSTLRGAQMASVIEGTAAPPSPFLARTKEEEQKGETKPNPDYEGWFAKDQTVLSFLLNSLSKEVLGQVPTTVQSAKDAWAAIEAMYASSSRARIISTRMALTTATKGSSTISEYFARMKSLADDMASAGKKIEDDEFVSYILSGLDLSWDAIVTAISTRTEPITVSECLTQLTAFEQRYEMKNGGSSSSVNIAARGGRGGNNYNPSRGRNGGGRGGGGVEDSSEEEVAVMVAAADPISSQEFFAKSAARKGIQHIGASRGSIRTILVLHRRLQHQQTPTRMA